MKSFSIAIAVIAGVVAISIALTYPRYHREMKAAKARLLAGGTILKMDHGDIEYAVEGEGAPVLSLHGAGGGYDQGLWAARMAFGDGHKLISASRYGYLRTPIPQNASIKAQAALYRDLLDHLRIERVIVLGTSAGGPSATQFANDRRLARRSVKAGSCRESPISSSIRGTAIELALMWSGRGISTGPRRAGLARRPSRPRACPRLTLERLRGLGC